MPAPSPLQRVGSNRATVVQVLENLEALGNDVMALSAF